MAAGKRGRASESRLREGGLPRCQRLSQQGQKNRKWGGRSGSQLGAVIQKASGFAPEKLFQQGARWASWRGAAGAPSHPGGERLSPGSRRDTAAAVSPQSSPQGLWRGDHQPSAAVPSAPVGVIR